MSWLASIQHVDDRGAIGPLPGEGDVIQVEADSLGDLGELIANTLARFPQVRDFDLTITNQDQIAVALAYYHRHYGPATREDIERAADPKRNFHTLAERYALEHAGIEVRR